MLFYFLCVSGYAAQPNVPSSVRVRVTSNNTIKIDIEPPAHNKIFNVDRYEIEARIARAGQPVGELQKIPTKHAVNSEYFEMDGQHFLAVCNQGEIRVDGEYYYDLYVSIYKYDETRAIDPFQEVQQIPAQKAASTQHIHINGSHFLAVANYDEVTNSTVYKYDRNSGQWEEHQSFETNQGQRFEYFQMNHQHLTNWYNLYKNDNL